MAGFLDFLAQFLPQQEPNRLTMVNDRYGDAGNYLVDPRAGLSMPSMAAPQGAQGVDPMQTAAPAPQTSPAQSGGGIGGFLGNLFQDPEARARNHTVQWLQRQGMDEGTATLMAGNKQALQQYLLQRSQGADPKDALQTEKLGLEIEQMRNPTTDDVREYQFAKREGYKGTFADWRKEKSGGLPAAVQEYEYAKAQGFPGTFQDWEASKKGGMSLQVDPETGAVTFQQGGNIKPMTEAQSKDAVYATRAQGALPIIDEFGSALTSFPESAGGAIPGVGNYLKSPEFQQAEQAGNEFLQAILRKDTGAAITAQEVAEYGSVYLPRPGDSAQVLDQKRISRQRALEALKAGMPPQAILAQEKALAKVDDAKVPSFTDNKQVFDAISSGQLKVGDTIILNGKRMRIDP